MANPRNGVKPGPIASWWKHMRRYGKREFWKKHRKQLKQEAKNDNVKGTGR